MDIDAIYRAIVDGVGDGGDLAWTRKALQHLALERAKTGDPEARLGALRVSGLLGPVSGMPIANELVTDADPRVRTLAFNQVVAARESGLPALRNAAGGADVELAIAALDLLVQWVDLPGAAVARRCLGSADARVRRRAVALLGQVAGPGTGPELRRLAETDPTPEVREAAAEALRRIAGELPKATRLPWWDETPEEAAATSPTRPAPTPASPAEALPVENLPATVPPAQESLPIDARGLFRRLGTAAADERPAAVEALVACPANERATVTTSWSPGSDPEVGRGLALAAAAMGDTGAASRVLTMLADPDPGVRTAAAEAVGALGSAGAIPRLGALFTDPDPPTAAAAIRAVAALSVRVGRPDVGRGQLSRVGGTVPDVVATAVAEARELLGAG